MQLADLSSELIVLVLQHLALPDISTMRVLNAEWNQFIKLHESVVYRNCAILHGYVSAGLSLDDAKNITYGSHWLTNVNSWKIYCNEYCNLDRRWDYRAQPQVDFHYMQKHNPPHRIKIDEEDAFILLTTHLGGLYVRCTISFEILWRIPSIFVRPSAHVEYSNGFAVFDRSDNSHEVWVKAVKADQFQEFSHPHPSQVQASQQAISNAEDSRGRFVPHLVLENPVRTRAYRFVFPELLVASEAETTAHIWNVVEGKIIEAYSLDEYGNGDEDSIHYVELSTRHIFVCFGTKLVVYQRASFSSLERDKLASGPPWKAAAAVFVLPRAFTSSQPIRFSVAPLPQTSDTGEALRITPVWSAPSLSPHFDERACFSAVHVSPDGRNLVAVTLEGLLFFARDFADRPDKRQVSAVEVNASIYNLAFDGTRVAFSAENGVFVFQLAPLPETQGHAFPTKAIYMAERFLSPVEVTCLQLTRTSLWYNMTPLHEFELPKVMVVDYANDAKP